MIEERLSFHPVGRVGKCAIGSCASLQIEQKTSGEAVKLVMSQISGLFSSFFFPHKLCLIAGQHQSRFSNPAFHDMLLLQCVSELLRNEKIPL